jgi:hypothetical protein
VVKGEGCIRAYKGNEYEGQWPAIFNPPDWERLQLSMRLRSANTAVKARKYLLTGLAHCGSCGAPLSGTQRYDRPGSPLRRMYVCRVRGSTMRDGGCGRLRRNADALDHFIKEAVLFRLDTPDLGALLAHGTPDDKQLADLLYIRAGHVKRIAAFVGDYATGLLTREQFAHAKLAAGSELRQVEAEIDRLNRERHGLTVSVGHTLREAWDKESDAWRRSLLALLIKRIDVRGALLNRSTWWTGSAIALIRP